MILSYESKTEGFIVDPTICDEKNKCWSTITITCKNVIVVGDCNSAKAVLIYDLHS